MKFSVFIDDTHWQDFNFDKSSIIIGRSKKSDALIDHDNVSRQHLKVEVENNKLFITDMGSSNGTRLNENKILPLLRTETPRMAEIYLGKSIRLAFTELSGKTAVYEKKRLAESASEISFNVDHDLSSQGSQDHLLDHGPMADKADNSDNDPLKIQAGHSFHTPADQSRSMNLAIGQNDQSASLHIPVDDVETSLTHRPPKKEKKIKSQAEMTLEMEAKKLKPEDSITVSKILKAENFQANPKTSETSGVRQNEAWQQAREKVRREQAQKRLKMLLLLLLLALLYFGYQQLQNGASLDFLERIFSLFNSFKSS